MNSYELSVARPAERHGYHWNLEPAHYCQWMHYFRYDDATHRVVLEVAARTGVQYALDIGANIGLYSLPMANALGPEGVVVAVEPHPTTFARLTTHVNMNTERRVRPIACALGRAPGVATLFDSGRDAGKRTMKGIVPDSAGVRVHVKTLDDVVSEQGLPRVDLIKIDVEGFEAQVILGAQNTLSKYRPTVVAELTPNWSEAALLNEALQFLAQLNYRFRRVGDADRNAVPPSSVDPTRIANGMEAERNWLIEPNTAG